jgi:hypothetical protein
MAGWRGLCHEQDRELWAAWRSSAQIESCLARVGDWGRRVVWGTRSLKRAHQCAGDYASDWRLRNLSRMPLTNGALLALP